MMSSSGPASATSTDAEAAALRELAIELVLAPASGMGAFAVDAAKLGAGGAARLHAASAVARRRRDACTRGDTAAILWALVRVAQPLSWANPPRFARILPAWISRELVRNTLRPSPREWRPL